jgi:hypothetical protein
MFVKLVQKAASYIKDVNEMGLFAIMSNKDIFAVFSGSPLFFTMLPMLGLLFTIGALIKGYELAKASNKNVDQWFGFIVSALCATLASISLYGAVFASYYGINFALGPWFFLASALVAFIHQATMLGINIYRAYESLVHSNQRMHYVQASLNNVFVLGLLTAVIGSVTFVMLSPMAPAIGSACALTAIGFTAASVLWRLLPVPWKRTLKNHVALGKSEFNESELLAHSSQLVYSEQLSATIENSHYPRMFTQTDHRAVIQLIPFGEGFEYLQKVIQKKIGGFNSLPLPHSEKNKQKKALLKQLIDDLNQGTIFSKERLLERHPLGFQSFWSEKGDVEQIVAAAALLQEKHSELSNERQFGII